MNKEINTKANSDTRGLGFLIMVVGVMLMSLKTFVPAASPHMPGGVLLTIVLLVLGGVMLVVGRGQFLKYLRSSLTLFLIPILSLVQSIILIDGNESSNLLKLLMLIVYPMFSSYVLAHRDERKIVRLSRRLLLYISALIVLTMVTTYKGNMDFPGASRDLAHYEADTTGLLPLYVSMNVGGFGFIYTITLVLPLLAYWLKTNKIALVFSLIGFVVAVLCIISSQYTTALLMSLISVVMCFFPRRIRPTHIFTFVGLFLVLLMLGTLIRDFFFYLSSSIEGDTMSSRLEEVYKIFSGRGVDTSSDTSTRIGHYNQSWNTFFNNILTGSRVGAGDHSYLVDTLAHFGIIGLAAIVISFRYMYKRYVANLRKTELYYYALACYMINLVQCYVNTYNGFVVFTLILPLFVVAFQNTIKQFN